MPTLRIEKNRNYTVMSNHHLRDKRLKLKTVGLLSIMLSLPDNWDFSANGLVQICGDGRTAVNSAIHELEIYGYLTRSYTRGENGQWADIEYIVREIPLAEVPITENRISDNQTQINTNRNKYLNDDGYADCFPDYGIENEESSPSPTKEKESLYGGAPLRDPDYAEVSAEYQRNFGLQPMGIISDILGDGIKDTCKEAVIYAIHSAKAAMAKNPYRYAEKVIHSMIAAGVTTPEGVEAYKTAHEPTQKKNTSGAVDWDALEAKLTKEHGDGV